MNCIRETNVGNIINRTLLHLYLAIFPFLAISLGFGVFSPPASAAEKPPAPLVLDNDHLRIEIDQVHGTIGRILDKQGQSICARRRVGGQFSPRPAQLQ